MHGEKMLAQEPLEMHYSTWRYRERFPALHAHDYYELFLFLKGEVNYVVEDYARSLSPGDMIIVPPGKFHRAAFDDLDKPYERMMAYVSREHMQSLHFAGFSVTEHIDTLSANRLYCHSIPPEDVKAWTRLYQAYSAETTHPAKQLENLCQLDVLIARICAQPEPSLSLPSSSVIGSVMTYINEHYREELTLDMLSQQFYLTSTHLSHLFRRYARLSVHQYITAKRMMLARTLLLQGSTPQEASASCGYQDYSSFYRAFIKSEGISPRCWQNAQLSEGL